MRAIIAAVTALCAAAAPAAAQSLLLDEEIESVLKDFTYPILEAADIRPEDVDFYLIGDRSINAGVGGGQNLYMNTGTILEAETPNQLKGVLAHEVGHMAGGHLVRSGRAETAAIGSMLMAMGVGMAAALAGAPDAGAAVMAGSQQFGYAAMARHTLFQESAADQAAATYLEQTRQSSEGLIEFFGKLRYEEQMRDRESGSMYYDFLRTHPLSSSRIAALRERVRGNPYNDREDSFEDRYKLSMIQAKIYGFTDAPNRVLRRYPDTDESDQARYARSIAHFRNGALDYALKEVDVLIEGAPENPYFQELKGQMLFESGRADQAIAPYREAVRLKPDSALFRTGLGQAIVAARDEEATDEAIANLREAVRLNKELPMAWYQLSLVYERAGERSLAQLATAEQSYAMGDYIRARQFANRAQEGLERGTTSWQRALDIMSTSEALAMEQAERMRRLSLSAHSH